MNDDRTFDGSTAGGSHWEPEQPAHAIPSSGLDMLEMLREQTDHRDQEADDELFPVPIPGLGWRLMCNTEFSYPQYRDWQKAALPPRMRSGRKTPNPMDLDQAQLGLLVLTETCEAVEFQKPDGSWAPLEHNGEALTVKHSEFLSKWNMVDPKSLVRKLFTVPGRSTDAELIRAGQLVIEKAGYGDGGDDDSDPTQ